MCMLHIAAAPIVTITHEYEADYCMRTDHVPGGKLTRTFKKRRLIPYKSYCVLRGPYLHKHPHPRILCHFHGDFLGWLLLLHLINAPATRLASVTCIVVNQW
jgi:hypothetical protein